MRSLRLIPLAALLALAAPAALPAQAAASGAFIVMLGNDTVGVERFTRTGNRVEGEILGRVPRTSRSTYVAELGQNGRLTSLQLRRFASAQGDSVAQTVRLRAAGDSVIMETEGGQGPTRRAVHAPGGVLPYMGNSYAFHELALQRLRAGDSVAVPVYPPGQPQPWTLHARRAADNTVSMGVALPGGIIEHEGRLDAQGRLVEVRGVRGSFGSNATRVAQFDMAAAARDFAARDREGRGLGAVSPRDTTRAQVAGATIEIDYSRPSARGRQVVGGIIQEGAVWRLGANQATHLRTDRDLAFGEHVIPAGQYTLFAVPGRSTWTLVVNRQTGQWGTEYHQDRDLVRIPMTATTGAHQEQLTLAVEPASGGGVLRLSWGDVTASAPFTVR